MITAFVLLLAVIFIGDPEETACGSLIVGVTACVLFNWLG